MSTNKKTVEITFNGLSYLEITFNLKVSLPECACVRCVHLHVCMRVCVRVPTTPLNFIMDHYLALVIQQQKKKPAFKV